MPLRKGHLLLTTTLLTLILGCNGGEMAEKTTHFSSIKDVPASTWEKLSQKKICFGHRSVGFNIMDGIKDLMKENPQIKLNIIETSEKADFHVGLFSHFRVGKNQDPKSKIDGFARLMEEGVGHKVDIALFKFCFVDVIARTDIENIFRYYKNNMSRLKERFTKVTFLHVTVPLMTVQRGPKAWIKKLIGRPVGGYNDNIKRNEFNKMLIKEYEGKEPVFDLAKVESTHPDGRMETFTKDGKNYYSLVPDYTDDGGHLNDKGRKIIAEQLLILLANLSE